MRNDWEFEYTASKLTESAIKQKEFRISRVAWWSEAKDNVMSEVRESGLEVSESIASSTQSYSGYKTLNIDGAPR